MTVDEEEIYLKDGYYRNAVDDSLVMNGSMYEMSILSTINIKQESINNTSESYEKALYRTLKSLLPLKVVIDTEDGVKYGTIVNIKAYDKNAYRFYSNIQIDDDETPTLYRSLDNVYTEEQLKNINMESMLIRYDMLLIDNNRLTIENDFSKEVLTANINNELKLG